MKKTSILSLILLTLSIVAVLSFYWLPIKNKEPQDGDTLTSDEGGVTVTVKLVTPLKPDDLEFEIELNTHSGELPEDLKGHAELLINDGQILPAFSWEMSSEQSHHQEGILSFRGAELEPEFIELILKDIGGVEERSFKWNLNK